MTDPPPVTDPLLAGAAHRVSSLLELKAAAAPKVFDRNPDAVLLIDAAGVVALANEQAEELTGWPLDRLVGMSVDELLPAPVRAAHAARRAGFAADGRARPMGTGMDLRLLDRFGQEVPVDINLAPTVLEQGRYVIAVVRRRAQ